MYPWQSLRHLRRMREGRDVAFFSPPSVIECFDCRSLRFIAAAEHLMTARVLSKQPKLSRGVLGVQIHDSLPLCKRFVPPPHFLVFNMKNDILLFGIPADSAASSVWRTAERARTRPRAWRLIHVTDSPCYGLLTFSSGSL